METRVVPMGQNNYLNYTLFIRTLIDMVGTPTKSLTITAEGSNDHVNFAAISGLTLSKTATGLWTAEGTAAFAWIRFAVNLTLAGSVGDTAEAIYDLQANLIRK